jgi:ABC-2 type transport system permease protein
MLQYSSNAMQVGTLVAVVVAAGALAFDAVPEMGVFLRTRVPVLRRLLVPRIVVTFVAVGVAFVLGGLAAWYETWALIGAPDASGVAAGIGLGVLYLGFVVALVTAVAGRTRTVLGTVMTAIVVLLVLPLVGLARAIGRWLPSTLAAALGPLAGGADPADYLPAALVTAGLIVVLVLLGVALARRKEL